MARVAVNPCRKALAPTGQISPRAEKAGEGLRAERLGDDARRRGSGSGNMCVPRRLQVNSSAGRPLVAERAGEALPEIRIRGGGVADEEAQRLADPHGVAERERPARLVEAEQTADEEVAGVVLRSVFVDHEPWRGARARRAPARWPRGRRSPRVGARRQSMIDESALGRMSRFGGRATVGVAKIEETAAAGRPPQPDAAKRVGPLTVGHPTKL